ncbi:MAG TPA: ATP-binding protein [Zeimonas sp.]
MSAPTLRGQLTFASLATTFIALLLAAGALLGYELNTYRRAWVEDLHAQADLIARATAAALVFDDRKAARENLALLESRHRIRSAAIYRNGGSAFAQYRADPEQTVPPVDPGGGIGSERFSTSTLEVVYPVEQDGVRIGSVFLRAQHDIRDRALGYAAILAVVSAVSLLLASFVFGRLQRVVTDPLARISDVAQRVMARRDWNLRAPPVRNRDIAALVDAFNGMLDEVKKATGELERETLERRQAEARLQLADRRKDEFLATLAHELRNPLAPMTNATTMIRLSQGNAGMRDKGVAILERQLRHIVRLIDDLLDISRITTGKLSLQIENVDLVRVLRSAMELADPAFAERRLAFTADIAEERFVVLGDSARLLQVLSNLLGNAARYTPAGGRVHLAMRALPDAVEIDVADTGIGIAREMQHRVFELFEQADKSLERGNAGLGIGLTLARQIVELHGGEIRLHSDGVGHGTTFTVRLPNPERSGEMPEASPPGVSRRPDRAWCVLVADDNVDFAWSLSVLLESAGHEVRVVHDGVDALQAIRARAPDIAILDIGMPRLNGYEVARRVRAEIEAPVMMVALTGWGQASDREAASRAGFDHHLVKPVAPEELLALVGRHDFRDAR